MGRVHGQSNLPIWKIPRTLLPSITEAHPLLGVLVDWLRGDAHRGGGQEESGSGG
jgi:hypothetical protein